MTYDDKAALAGRHLSRLRKTRGTSMVVRALSAREFSTRIQLLVAKGLKWGLSGPALSAAQPPVGVGRVNVGSAYAPQGLVYLI